MGLRLGDGTPLTSAFSEIRSGDGTPLVIFGPGGPIYLDGNEYTSQTGGWQSGYQQGGAAIEIRDTYILIRGGSTLVDQESNATVTTSNKIDLSGISTIEFRYEPTQDSGRALFYLADTDFADDIGKTTVTKPSYSGSDGETTTTLDVSSVTGTHYIHAGSNDNDPGEGKDSWIRLYEVNLIE